MKCPVEPEMDQKQDLKKEVKNEEDKQCLAIPHPSKIFKLKAKNNQPTTLVEREEEASVDDSKHTEASVKIPEKNIQLKPVSAENRPV